MSKPTRITPKPDTDLPRHLQTFPPGSFPRVYAPQFDPVLRIWRWPEMPAWAGLPRSERKERRR